MTTVAVIFDAVSHITESEPEVLATSPSRDGNSAPGSEKPKGDSEICKNVTYQVIEMQRNSILNPISTVEHVDEDGQKHIAVAGGVKLIFVGDKTVSGYVSFPAPAPSPGKK